MSSLGRSPGNITEEVLDQAPLDYMRNHTSQGNKQVGND